MLTVIFLLVTVLIRVGHLMSPCLHAIVGILGVLVGIYLVVEPGRGALAAIWAIGVIAVSYGIPMIMSSFRIRSPRNQFVADPKVKLR